MARMYLTNVLVDDGGHWVVAAVKDGKPHLAAVSYDGRIIRMWPQGDRERYPLWFEIRGGWVALPLDWEDGDIFPFLTDNGRSGMAQVYRRPAGQGFDAFAWV